MLAKKNQEKKSKKQRTFRAKSQQIITKLNKLGTDYKSCRQAVGEIGEPAATMQPELSCGCREVRSPSPIHIASFCFVEKSFWPNALSLLTAPHKHHFQ